MRIRRKWLRDISSVVFSIYYLIAAEQADEKVRKVRGTLTVDHLRVSWNKGTTPYLSLLSQLLRPKLTRYPPRAIRIPRPRGSSYREPVSAWLYFDGPLSALKNHKNIVLDVPGGGFVAMNPRTSDDKLLGWAGRTGVPVLSLDYKKAPEFPYPYALNECYDVYRALVASHGRCIGFSGEHEPRIVVTGDSAGGNLATGLVLMILQSGEANTRRPLGDESLPVPEGLILIYPALDMNIGSWMTDEQMSLIKDRRMRKTNRAILRRKSEDYNKLTPSTPHHSDDEDEVASPPRRPRAQTTTAPPLPNSKLSTNPDPSAAHTTSSAVANHKDTVAKGKPQVLKTRLAMSSMISYFNDRILTPEMMRAMIILYVGPHNRPDFTTDYLLSPLLAPESLLARFPKTYFQTGERDPLVDDTVIFAGRIRQAKYARWTERKELGLLQGREARSFEESAHVEVVLIPGISHGFLQFAGVLPEAWKYIFRCARWMQEVFAQCDAEDARSSDRDPEHDGTAQINGHAESHRARKRHHTRTRTESSGDEDRPLEMMRMGPLPGSKNPSHPSTSASTPRATATPPPHASSLATGKKPNGYTHPGAPSAARRGRSGTAPTKLLTEDEQDVDEQDPNRGGTDAEQHWNGVHTKRTMSSVSLASEDDLLGRRMKGLAGGLMGMTGVEEAR